MKKILLASIVLLGTYGYGQISSTTRYKGSGKVYELDKSVTDCTAAPSVYRTNDFAIYHGDKYPVYLSKRGKLFIWVVSRETGNTYRKYIK